MGWACSLWLCLLGCLLKKLLRCDLLLTPRLLLRAGLVVLLQAVSHCFLPLLLSAALTGTACWLVLGGAARGKRIPAAGKAVFITGESGRHPGSRDGAHSAACRPPAVNLQG